MRNSYSLFCKERFLPLFLAQFQEALTDNLIKCALVIVAVYEVYLAYPTKAGIVVGLSGALLMLPFFMFSALAGQLADKFDKAILVRYIKVFEIFSMMLASYGFYTKNITLLLITVFLLGVHSAFFGPIKYSILPQHLKQNELIAGNAFVQGGTFVAILIGYIMGNQLPMLINSSSISAGAFIVSLIGLFFAIVGAIISFYIPLAPPMSKNVKIDYNIFRSTKEIVSFAKKNNKVYIAIIGNSWFWLIGMTFMTILPSMVKDTLNSSPGVYTFLLIIFSLGIAVGTIICEKVQGDTINTFYVPFGSIGMAVFTIVLCLLIYLFSHSYVSSEMYDLATFLSLPLSWGIMASIVLISIFSGFFAVPLTTVIQYWTDIEHMSRVIAALKIMNAIYMVAGALFFAISMKLGLDIPIILFIFGVINLAVTFYIIRKLPKPNSL